MLFKDNSTFVITGDSVTDCGRQRPLGRGTFNLGSGYASLINAALRSNYPEMKIQVINTGISGDTSRGLLARSDTDIMDLNPDYVSILIGINDVWRHFDYAEFIEEVHISVEEYESNMRAMIEKIQPRAKVILITPFFLELNRADEMRAMTDKYSDVVRKLAAEYNTVLVDMQAEFDKLLPILYTNKMSNDRVHPNPISHYFMAKKILEALGCQM